MLEHSQSETLAFPRRIARRQIPTAREVVVSVNPRAGRQSSQRLVPEIDRELRLAGYEVHVTVDLDDLASVSGQLQRAEKLRAVVAIGGDGTAAVVRNRVPIEIPMVPFPMGTENLLGRYVDQVATAGALRETLDDGVVVGLDLGRANGRFFLLMISAGFDADVIRRLHENRQGNITRASYIWPTLAAIRSYGHPELQLYCDDSGETSGQPVSCRWLFGFNLPLYAVELKIAPDAVGTDGLLDVCTFQRSSAADVIRYWWHVVRQGHLALADASLNRCRRFRLQAEGEANVAFQIDGDFGGTLPVDVEVLPGELRLLVPRETARRLGFDLDDEIEITQPISNPIIG